MWIANVAFVSSSFGQAVVAIEPNRPSRFLLIGSEEPLGCSYQDVYERALIDGRPVLVAYAQAPTLEAAARKTAFDRGWHFCAATADDGFRPGLHELVVKAGRLVFRERMETPKASNPAPRSRPASGCGP